MRDKRGRVMISVKPRFGDLIFGCETKRFEFRRRLWQRASGSEVLVYCTAPMSGVVGRFKAGDILDMPLDKLWAATERWAGITRAEFDKYFAGLERGLAMEIIRPVLFGERRKLSYYDNAEFSIKSAPQSYVFVDNVITDKQP